MMALLHTYDHYLLAFFALFGTFGACLVFWILAHRSRFGDLIARYRGLSPPFVNVVGVLFALTLAFLANDTWNAHDRATNAAFQEAGALKSIQALSQNLPPHDFQRVQGLLRHYVQLTVDVEWELLARRQGSPEASDALASLLAELSSDRVARGLNPTAHAQMLTQAAAVRVAHEQRVALSQTHVNPLKWLGMAFLGFLTMIAIAMVYQDQPKAELLAILIFAAAAAPTAAIVLIQGNPYLHPSAVSPAPIAQLR